MKLLIDIGNTFVKYCTDRRPDEIISCKLEQLSEELFSFIQGKEISGGLYCSVAKPPEDVTHYLENTLTLRQLTYKTAIPIVNAYETPETLGMDRLAGIVGVWSEFKGNTCLLIDMGTCIKYDVITAEGEYQGGSISPGIMMRYKAMHTFTERLPLLEADWRENEVKWPGKSTSESMHNGVIQGVTGEVERFIRLTEATFGEIKVIVTGGDSLNFATYLKNRIFARPNIILTGLSEIVRLTE
jgi:type III pantothenate kinase